MIWLLLDLFCGIGGASRGYADAGFRVIGVDVNPQPHYPYPFLQMDAIEALNRLLRGEGLTFSDGHTYYLHVIAVIHASPPCQFKTQMAAAHRAHGRATDRPDLLTPTRPLLKATGKPYVIENVVGAKAMMQATLRLHGGMFGLGVHRPRLFESNVLILAPHTRVTKEPIGVYGYRPVRNWSTRLNGDYKGRSTFRVARSLEEAQKAMGMDWGDYHGVKEAIPPAYTEHIGHQLIVALESGDAA